MEPPKDIISLMQHNVFNLCTGFAMGIGLTYAIEQGRLDHAFLSMVCPGLYLGLVASDVFRSFLRSC
jgi:hypothetical protein